MIHPSNPLSSPLLAPNIHEILLKNDLWYNNFRLLARSAN